mmetsp:Transcript_11860/g.23702  ORF Transcript_11860/g.23702 Transcript_11860/m.23702 type:complete len:143 (-) Transcript_11860:74-502(-)|eukprot:CAMPEP_0181339732 /NCGR_PEP_ID=MMETSP1101-20121128/29443_1 /TAXON_ID=46948 /ORGANISM="Rhodomonas abbreviata, Strain Caron Lab Isolate" /LENGTH=142 /DNA_ID=CAMNT_0023450781 /DNA_START=60 /DNA_END=488 /DNA_ORIENTATION=+
MAEAPEDFAYPERYIGVDVAAKVGGRVVMSERYKELHNTTPGGAHLHIGRIFYEPQTDCSDEGPGTVEEVWDNGSWVRVKWDITGETGCYWIASMWTCLPHNTGGHDKGRHGCSPLVSIDPPPPPTPPPEEDTGEGDEEEEA